MQSTSTIVACFADFILLYLSLINMAGEAGFFIANILRMLLGNVSFIVPVIFLVIGIIHIRLQQNPDYKNTFFTFQTIWGMILMTVSLAAFINIVKGVDDISDPVSSAGGYLGYIIYPLFLYSFSPIGASVVVFALAFYGFFLITGSNVAEFVEKCKEVTEDPKKVWDMIPDVYDLWRTEAPAGGSDTGSSESESEKPKQNLDDMISSVIYDGSISNNLNLNPTKTADPDADEPEVPKRRYNIFKRGKAEAEPTDEDKIKEFIDVVISKPEAGDETEKAKPKFKIPAPDSEAEPASSAPADSSSAQTETNVGETPTNTANTFNSATEDDTPRIKKPKPQATWNTPATNLLKISRGKSYPGDVERNKTIIQDTLEHFGIKVQMSDTYIGPTVTQYTLKPANGVRLSTIDGLQRDLALALASPSIRIEAPIAGKSLVGIEIPNERKSPVRLGDIIYHPKFQQFKGDLPIAVGKDVAGNEMVYSLAKAPHLLVAGATGAGKSVWINGMLLSLVTTYSPYDLQLIMVDMKRVELKLYEGIPHLMCSVITEADKAINSLKWTVLEMDRRYSLLEKHGKRNINDYNEFAKSPKNKGDEKAEFMPYLVFVIDELGDLMMLAKAEVEPIIVRLTQMSRAVGIHLVLGTQRPDTNVVTGLIKANVPTRIAFTVASQIDSRVILDSAGAEKLLGMGDGLISTPTLMKPVRFQGPFVEEEEVVNHVKALIKQAADIDYANHNDEITEKPKTRINVPGMTPDKKSREEAADDTYEEAKRTVVMAQKASTSFLQQSMGVGYPKAAKLINKLEQEGVVGPQNGSKPRDVYLLPEDLELGGEDEE